MKYRASAVAFVAFFVPLIAFGAPLLPQCVTNPGGGAISGVACNLCDFILLIQNIINYLIFLAIPIAVVLFAIAGFKYFTAGGDHGKIEEAHHIFRDAGIGFIIAISGWLVVDLFIHTVVSKDYFANGTSWNTVVCPAGRQTQGSIGNWIQNAFGGSTSYLPPSGNTGGGSIQGGGTSAGNTGGTGNGKFQYISTVGPDGEPLTVQFKALQDDNQLARSFVNTWATYGDQINDACSDSPIPNCAQVVTSLITAESGGNPATPCNQYNSCGIMQLSANQGGASCAASNSQCITTQIKKGVNYLNTAYTSDVTQESLSNTLAAYNAGLSTIPGTSPSQKDPAMMTSSSETNSSGQYTKGCGSTYYAWQCSNQPGGLTQTQQYVATICRSIQINGGHCN